MNYFPFHVGDYAAHTAHLTWEEDLIYRRLLDLYYLHEKALTADVDKLARLIRMPNSAPIESVLQEFFELRDDGWHNKRADQELAEMAEKAEAAVERDDHEKGRMKRYRERRAQMFKELRGVGIVPAWDVPMKELQRLYDASCNAPATHLQRNVVVSDASPATAIPTPTPTPTPTPKEEREESIAKGGAGGKVHPRGARLPTDWAPDPGSCDDARQAGLSPDRIPLEAAKFRDYWHAQPGQKGVKADWPATWRNWCRKAAEHVPRGATGPPIWRERQLETAALMTGATRAATRTQQDALDVESRIIPSRALG